ncbi:MAG TPA: PilZ domain-containing protein [Candidatus Acidoferrum sp.]|nr:PilZ domain-containing protein [Candidatus Acidoferrum sp.]
MHKPDLRRHQRILVPAGHVMRAVSNGTGPHLDGTVTVIGLGGMFIRTAKPQPFGTVLKLKLEDPVASFEAECTVRHVADNGVGVEITNISIENEQRLKALLLRLKA